MNLDNILWDFCNSLTHKGVPNYIHWDFSRRVEITGPNPIYPEGFYTPLFYLSKDPIEIELIPV